MPTRCTDCTPPNNGAACDSDGVCHFPTTQEEADANGWIYKGDGSLCETVECDPFGAACELKSDGTIECHSNVTEAEALANR